MTAQSLPATRTRPLATQRLLAVWLAFAATLIAAPHVFTSSLALSHLTQMGTAIVLGLSYNILLGQTGMLSFGHAAYSGMGAFVSVHAMNAAAAGAVWLPLPLIPVVGALTGLGCAALIGYVITRTSGVTFAMITLGIGQMVYASSLMFPAFFGGEGGVSTDRVYGDASFGWNFGPQLQVYYLVAAWMFLCVAGAYYLTRTPLGRLFNGVRDNPERVAFVGFNPHLLRYLSLMFAGLFAGVGGSLMAINFEIATAEVLGLHESSMVLLFTFIGGTKSFIGPIVGAIIGILLTKALPDYTAGWQMYLGLIFILVVVYAPGGISSLFRPTLDVVRKAVVLHEYLALSRLVASLLALLSGTVLLVELMYHRASGSASPLELMGLSFGQGIAVWVAATVILLFGMLAVKPSGRALIDRLAGHDVRAGGGTPDA